MQQFRVAAVQASPVFLDRAATVVKIAGLVRTAAAGGAKLVVFPESFLPTYPVWSWFLKPSQFDLIESLYGEYLDQSVSLPGPETAEIGKVAKETGVYVALGACERNVEASGASMFNSIAFIGPDGSLVGKRRKLVATGAERLVWASGDGSTVGVVETSLGKLGGLICWENYMPLARYAMYAGGAEVILSPTWDQNDVWQATMRHIAKEGRAYVIGCSNAMRRADIPERYGFHEFLPDKEWINRGGTVIVDPEGEIMAGPLYNEEGILYADLDPATLRGLKWNLDVAGHYARPDVFTFAVDRTVRTP